jgi:hypothetical protein
MVEIIPIVTVGHQLASSIWQWWEAVVQQPDSGLQRLLQSALQYILSPASARPQHIHENPIPPNPNMDHHKTNNHKYPFFEIPRTWQGNQDKSLTASQVFNGLARSTANLDPQNPNYAREVFMLIMFSLSARNISYARAQGLAQELTAVLTGQLVQLPSAL